MVTDTKRILRTDPGRPEVCNVCQLHRFFGDDYEEIWDGERTARTGCVDTKKLLAERIVAPLRAGPRALPRADGRPRRGRRRSSRPAPTASGRWPRRRWPRSGRRWACADGRCPDPRTTRERPAGRRAPRPRRSSRCSSSSSAWSRQALLLLRRHPADFFLAWLLAFIISPVVTAHRRCASRGSRGPWPRSSSTRWSSRSWCVARSSSRPARWRPRSPSSSPRSRTSARDLPTILAPWQDVARLASGSARSTWSPRTRPPGQPRRVRRRRSSGRSSRSRSRASARSARC